jgi:glycosyltransferase involved in cell wall biosynthesis
MDDRAGPTAVLITLNGQRVLEPCLASLDFCGKILVVDSGSTDQTEAIARGHHAVFLCNPWPGYAGQIRFALDWLERNAPAEWVLYLDCDEICTDGLRESIRNALAAPGEAGAFSLNRLTWYYDRFLRHGGAYPDRLFRLFRPEALSIEESGGHPQFVPRGKTGRLQGDLLHFTYASFQNQLEKLNVYAQRGSAALQAEGKKGGVMAGLGHGLWRFFSMYCLRLGFLDGRAGFLMAAHTAFYTFLKYARVNEGSWGESLYRDGAAAATGDPARWRGRRDGETDAGIQI